MLNKKFIYLATIRLPTEKAHGLQIMKTCAALAKEGIEVELIVPQRKNPINQDPFVFYSVEKNFNLKKVGSFDFISSGLFGSLGFWLQSWFLYRKISKRLTLPAFRRRLRGGEPCPPPFGCTVSWQALKRGGGQRTHPSFQGGGQGGGLEPIYYTRDLPLALFLANSKKPFFYEIHTLPAHPGFLHRHIWKRAQGIITISDGLKNELIHYGVPTEKILVARDAVDMEHFHLKVSATECRKELGLPINKKIIVYTGHLYAWKGAHLVAEAALHLSSNIEVYLIGGTSDDITAFRKTYYSPNLHIVGFKPHDQIPRWLRAADLLVLPTSGRERIGARYTSPLKLFEYIASGTPIVAANLPSLKEILTEDTVVFFEADSSSDLVQKINTAFDTNKYQQLVAASHQLTQYCAREYTWTKRAQRIKDFILQRVAR